jgi:heme-degrading monooxygenase HmoA
MLVRVLIERHIKKGREQEALNTILEMRASATKELGYVSGETLEDAENHGSYLIISTWNSINDWKRWESSQEHQSLLGVIEPLLEEPASISVCVNPWDALNSEETSPS